MVRTAQGPFFIAVFAVLTAAIVAFLAIVLVLWSQKKSLKAEISLSFGDVRAGIARQAALEPPRLYASACVPCGALGRSDKNQKAGHVRS